MVFRGRKNQENNELPDLYYSLNITLMIKSSRMRWVRHVAHMVKREMQGLVRRPEGKKPLSRLRCGLEDNTGLFEMIVGVIRCYSPGHLVLQMQPHVISFYGVMSKIRFMFLPQVSRN